MLDDAALERVSSDAQELSSLDDGSGLLEGTDTKQPFRVPEIEVFEVNRHAKTIRQKASAVKPAPTSRAFVWPRMSRRIFFVVTVTREGIPAISLAIRS